MCVICERLFKRDTWHVIGGGGLVFRVHLPLALLGTDPFQGACCEFCTCFIFTSAR